MTVGIGLSGLLGLPESGHRLILAVCEDNCLCQLTITAFNRSSTCPLTLQVRYTRW